MNTKSSVIVSFLCFLTLFTLTDGSTCQNNVLEGNSITLTLTNGSLKSGDRVTIKKDSNIIVHKKHKNHISPWILKGDKNLELQSVNPSDSGKYEVEVIDVKGQIKTSSETFCVYAKLPKPTLIITCQNEQVNFRCDVETPDPKSPPSYSWIRNGKEYKTNIVNVIQVNEDDSMYACTVQNPVHNNTSDAVKAANCSTCQNNVLEGNSITLTLTHGPLKSDDRVTIKNEQGILKVEKKNKNQISPWILKGDKYLQLQSVNRSDSGTYTVEVTDGKEKIKTSPSETFCVYAKLPKPTLNITCQNDLINFRCDVETPDPKSPPSYSWSRNGKEYKTNTVNVIQVKEDDSVYACTVQNPVHNNTSDAVKATCPKHSSGDEKKGFDFWTMVGILAGGGALVLVLIIVACCCCKRR